MNRHERRKELARMRKVLGTAREAERDIKLGRVRSGAGVPPQACPQCRAKIDGASHRLGLKAAPGHVCICIRCGGVNQFNAEMQLIAMTEAEIDAFGNADEVREHQKWIRKANQVSN